jgi:hypothetical protein
MKMAVMQLQTVLIDWPIWSGKTRNTDASSASMLVFRQIRKIMP